MTPLLLAAPVKIKAPSLQYGALSPILIVFGIALAGVLVEAFLPSKYRRTVQPALVVLGFVAIAGAYLGLADYVAKEIVEFVL